MNGAGQVGGDVNPLSGSRPLATSSTTAAAEGAEGARHVEAWLEATTRVNVHWANSQPIAKRKLAFNWVDGTQFSLDGHVHLHRDR
jgi:hypothetical protein